MNFYNKFKHKNNGDEVECIAPAEGLIVGNTYVVIACYSTQQKYGIDIDNEEKIYDYSLFQ